MVRIDLHVLRGFIAPFLILTAVALGLLVMLDVIREIDDVSAQAESGRAIIERLGWLAALSAPAWLVFLIPLTTLIAGAFAIAHLERHNELLALKASGISVYRILVPIFITAAMFSFGGAAAQEFLVPTAEPRLDMLRDNWKGRDLRRREGWAEEIFYTLAFDSGAQTISEVSLTVAASDGLLTIRAKSGEYDRRGWRLRDVVVSSGRLSETHSEWFWQTPLTPQDLTIQREPRAFDLATLAELARKDPANTSYSLTLYTRLAYPFQGILLLLVGAPVILSRETVRKSRLFGAGVAVILGGAYYVVSFFCNNLAMNGHLPPIAAAGLPLVLFAAIGLYLFDRVPT